MEYSVYSYGGAEILWKVFNGCEMVFESTYFQSLSVLMVGIGILVIAARAIPVGSLPIIFKNWMMPTFFLMAFFWGPKVAVNIIDKVDTDFKYAKVKSVPLGLAMAASFSSQISETLTEIIETKITSSDMQQFSKVGPMFATRLIHEAHTLSIRDPLIRENLKDFTLQCFAWPYIFSNISPGKKAALETDDMLTFIEQNPHPLLGIYWRKAAGKTEFLDCKQCAAKVREILPIEVEIGLESLARKVFNTSSNGDVQTKRLRQYFGDAWQFLAKSSSDASNVIQQELMLNSYREALQDERERLGLNRHSAQMTYVNAERGQASQDSSFLVKAALAGTQIPMLHTIMFALSIIFFTIVAPFTFISGGVRLIMSWAKVMVWLATWPPLFAILNALGYMFAAKSTAAHMVGCGSGLNLMTQNGLADSAYNAYCFVMGLQHAVPFVSWALISSGGGYALSQLSSFLTQSGEAFAGKVGSETVDGNVSFDSQTMHYRSVGNTQLAQQQLGPSFNYGQKFDDGKLETLYGPNGQAVFREHQTQMGTNVSQNDALSSMFAVQGAMALNSAMAHSKTAAAQMQMGTNKLLSLMDTISNNKSLTETFGEHGSSNVQKSFSNTMDLVKQVAKDHNISTGSAFSLVMGAGLKVDPNLAANMAKNGIGKGLLAGAHADISGNQQFTAHDNEIISSLVKSGKAEQFATTFGQGIQLLEDNKGMISDNLTRQKMDQIQEHYNEASTHATQAAASMQESRTWNESASQQRQKGVSSSSNLNEIALRRKADSDFGGDVNQAAHWASQNPSAYQQEVSQYIDSRGIDIRPKELSTSHDVYKHYEDSSHQIPNEPREHSQFEKNRVNSNREFIDLEANIDQYKKQTQFNRSLLGSAADVNQKIGREYDEKEKEFKEESGKLNITRAVGGMFR